MRVGLARWTGATPYDGLGDLSACILSVPRAGTNSPDAIHTSTATRSPSLKSFTPSPTSVTIALNSCPNVSGTVSPVIGCGVVGHKFGPPMYSWRSDVPCIVSQFQCLRQGSPPACVHALSQSLLHPPPLLTALLVCNPMPLSYDLPYPFPPFLPDREFPQRMKQAQPICPIEKRKQTHQYHRSRTTPA